MKNTISAVIMACVTTLASAAPAQKQPNSQQLAKVLRAVVKEVLLDAPSARFKDEFISLHEDDTSDILSLCGFVNSKNAYGGYVGFKPFISSTNGKVIFDTTELPEATKYLWPVWCGRPLKDPSKGR